MNLKTQIYQQVANQATGNMRIVTSCSSTFLNLDIVRVGEKIHNQKKIN